MISPVDLVTERLRLRPATRADLPALERTWTDEQVRRHLGGPLAPELVRTYREKWRPTGEEIAVELPGGAVVGFFFFDRRGEDAELSYLFLPEHWGLGYAREAAAALLAWFPGAHPGRRLVAVTQAANTASVALLAAVGMVKAEEFVEHGADQYLYVLHG